MNTDSDLQEDQEDPLYGIDDDSTEEIEEEAIYEDSEYPEDYEEGEEEYEYDAKLVDLVNKMKSKDQNIKDFIDNERFENETDKALYDRLRIRYQEDKDLEEKREPKGAKTLRRIREELRQKNLEQARIKKELEQDYDEDEEIIITDDPRIEQKRRSEYKRQLAGLAKGERLEGEIDEEIIIKKPSNTGQGRVHPYATTTELVSQTGPIKPRDCTPKKGQERVFNPITGYCVYANRGIGKKILDIAVQLAKEDTEAAGEKFKAPRSLKDRLSLTSIVGWDRIAERMPGRVKLVNRYKFSIGKYGVEVPRYNYTKPEIGPTLSLYEKLMIFDRSRRSKVPLVSPENLGDPRYNVGDYVKFSYTAKRHTFNPAVFLYEEGGIIYFWSNEDQGVRNFQTSQIKDIDITEGKVSMPSDIRDVIKTLRGQDYQYEHFSDAIITEDGEEDYEILDLVPGDVIFIVVVGDITITLEGPIISKKQDAAVVESTTKGASIVSYDKIQGVTARPPTKKIEIRRGESIEGFLQKNHSLKPSKVKESKEGSGILVIPTSVESDLDKRMWNKVYEKLTIFLEMKQEDIFDTSKIGKKRSDTSKTPNLRESWVYFYSKNFETYRDAINASEIRKNLDLKAVEQATETFAEQEPVIQAYKYYESYATALEKNEASDNVVSEMLNDLDKVNDHVSNLAKNMNQAFEKMKARVLEVTNKEITNFSELDQVEKDLNKKIYDSTFEKYGANQYYYTKADLYRMSDEDYDTFATLVSYCPDMEDHREGLWVIKKDGSTTYPRFVFPSKLFMSKDQGSLNQYSAVTVDDLQTFEGFEEKLDLLREEYDSKKTTSIKGTSLKVQSDAAKKAREIKTQIADMLTERQEFTLLQEVEERLGDKLVLRKDGNYQVRSNYYFDIPETTRDILTPIIVKYLKKANLPVPILLNPAELQASRVNISLSCFRQHVQFFEDLKVSQYPPRVRRILAREGRLIKPVYRRDDIYSKISQDFPQEKALLQEIYTFKNYEAQTDRGLSEASEAQRELREAIDSKTLTPRLKNYYGYEMRRLENYILKLRVNGFIDYIDSVYDTRSLTNINYDVQDPVSGVDFSVSIKGLYEQVRDRLKRLREGVENRPFEAPVEELELFKYMSSHLAGTEFQRSPYLGYRETDRLDKGAPGFSKTVPVNETFLITRRRKPTDYLIYVVREDSVQGDVQDLSDVEKAEAATEYYFKKHGPFNFERDTLDENEDGILEMVQGLYNYLLVKGDRSSFEEQVYIRLNERYNQQSSELKRQELKNYVSRIALRYVNSPTTVPEGWIVQGREIVVRKKAARYLERESVTDYLDRQKRMLAEFLRDFATNYYFNLMSQELKKGSQSMYQSLMKELYDKVKYGIIRNQENKARQDMDLARKQQQDFEKTGRVEYLKTKFVRDTIQYIEEAKKNKLKPDEIAKKEQDLIKSVPQGTKDVFSMVLLSLTSQLVVAREEVEAKKRSEASKILKLVSEINQLRNIMIRKYKKNNDYLFFLEALITFLDPKNPIGMYSVNFRAKIESGMYLVSGLADATLPHFIPELYMISYGEIEAKKTEKYQPFDTSKPEDMATVISNLIRMYGLVRQTGDAVLDVYQEIYYPIIDDLLDDSIVSYKTDKGYLEITITSNNLSIADLYSPIKIRLRKKNYKTRTLLYAPTSNTIVTSLTQYLFGERKKEDAYEVPVVFRRRTRDTVTLDNKTFSNKQRIDAGTKIIMSYLTKKTLDTAALYTNNQIRSFYKSENLRKYLVSPSIQSNCINPDGADMAGNQLVLCPGEDQEGKKGVYCFTRDQLIDIIQSEEVPTNPYTGSPFSRDLVEKMTVRYNLDVPLTGLMEDMFREE